MSKINNDNSDSTTAPLKQKPSNNNDNKIINIKEDDEQETKDETHQTTTFHQDQENIDKKIIELIPGEPILNDVKKRYFILSPIVELGFERECNKYDFIHEGKSPIGRGAFGEVWKVTHENSRKVYCIKILNKRDIFEQKLIYQINKEISIMYNVNHPYSVKLVNHFEDNEKLYLIMELVTNGNLYNLIQKNKKEKKTNLELIKKIIIQTIEIIKYLHSLNIIYRDLKPENLLLDENNNIKLCDYGWATFFTPGKFLTVYCGTPEYVSPEMLKKYPYNERVDIWGLGVLIFELVFGYAPFASNFNEDRYNNIKEGKINWPEKSDLNSDLKEEYKDIKDLIVKILRTNPKDRLTLEQIEEHPWLKKTFLKMKKNKQTNDTFENNNKMSQTEIYKTNIMNNGISKLFNSDKRIKRINSYFELENDGSLSDKELLNIYKVENNQLRLKILKVEENNRVLQKKCSDYNDLCFLNEKLNKKVEENQKQIYTLKSKLEQRDETITENEKKIKELIQEKNQYKDCKNNYDTLNNELLNVKKLMENIQKNNGNDKVNVNDEIQDSEILNKLNTFLNNFKIEMEKLTIFNQTRNNIIEKIIKKEFDNHAEKIHNIMDDNNFLNSKPYKTIEFLNDKIEELYGYKIKVEAYISKVDLLLNEQKLLKDQIKVYKQIADESMKLQTMQKEKLEEFKLEENKTKENIKKTKKYIQKHFSLEMQNELFKLLGK